MGQVLGEVGEENCVSGGGGEELVEVGVGKGCV